MKKLTVFASLLFSASAFSQTIDDGIKAWENDKFGQATSIFRKLTQSNNPEAYYYLGNILSETDKVDSAKISFNKGITANASSPYCYIGLGKLMLNEKDVTGATANFDKALKISREKDIKVMNMIAEAYITSDNKNPAKAREILTKALELDKKNITTYILMGDAYLEEGQGGPAISNYEKALEINNKNAKPYLRIGQIYSRARNYNEGLNNLQKAIELEPNYAPAHRDLGELYYKSGQYKKAKDTYQKYISLSDKNISTYTRYASFLFLSKDYDEAITAINEVLQMDSSSVVMKRLLGYSYYEKQKFPEGLSYMTKFFGQVKPERVLPSDYEYLGKLLYKNGKDSLAIINLQMAIEKDTSKKELYGDIAESYLHWKKYSQAIESYNKKMAAGKKLNAIEYFGMGRSYYFNKQYVEADSAFSKVVQIKPNVTLGYLWRARTQQQIGDPTYEKTKLYADKYVELANPGGVLDPKANKKELVEIYKYVVQFYAQKEDKTKIKEYLNKILEIDPENKEAKDNLGKIK